MHPALLAALAPALLPPPVPAASPGEPAELATRIEEVVVFPGQALVRRVGEAPEGGRLVLRGLPAALDPETLRVRCSGGEVLGLETRERVQAEVEGGRVPQLRAQLRELERERRALSDERSLADDVKGHLQRLLRLEESAHAEDLGRGRADPAAWKASLEFVTGELTAARARLREVEWSLEELDLRIADVEADLGRSQAGAAVRRRDVLLDVVALGEGPVSVELEYLVGGAGWSPLYDLRAAPDARSVELSYRAHVWQQSGEDWEDVAILLSTARPSLGAQGPEPRPVWLRLLEPRSRRAPAARAELPAAARALEHASAYDDDGEADRADPSATVESQGLSLRYRLRGRETIESRAEPATVLVGQATLAVRPEHYAVPSLDTNVWLRGVATNTSEWTLLPGAATVFFGADYVGRSNLDLVQPGAELTLHLGADPALTLERKQLQDLTEPPGIFGSRVTQSETWLVRIENHGAAAGGPDAGARVIVREPLPRSTDERLKVELAEAEPKPAQDERSRREREEDGLLTWILDVPRQGGNELRYTLEISYPQGARVVR